MDTGGPIKVPVGREVLGRLFNVVGDTIGEKGPINTEAGQGAFPPQHMHGLEKSGTGGAAGDGHADGLGQGLELEALINRQSGIL